MDGHKINGAYCRHPISIPQNGLEAINNHRFLWALV